MPSRRAVLAASMATLAGCSSLVSTDPDPENHVPDEWHDEPKRGLADPRDVTEDVDPDEIYDLDIECPYVAGRAALEPVHAQLDDLENVGGAGCCIEIDGVEAVVIERVIFAHRDGSVGSSPSFTFRKLRKATPRTVTATVSDGSNEHTCEVPVFNEDVMVFAG
jgi:hypothetical protein